MIAVLVAYHHSHRQVAAGESTLDGTYADAAIKQNALVVKLQKEGVAATA